jgi:hypothetical protein
MNPKIDITFVIESQYMNVVDALALLWAGAALTTWYLCGHKLKPLAEVFAAEIILLPLFAIAQILTVVPDSYPNCLSRHKIPTDGHSWIWTRFGRGCGNMLWSSALAQFVVFFNLLRQISKKKSVAKCLLYVVAIVYVSTIASFTVLSRYQYMGDMFLATFVSALVCTHTVVPRLANACFIRVRSAKLHDEEEVPLVNRAEI